MGTLFNQPVRKWLEYNDQDIINFIEQIQEISKKTKLSVDQIINIYEIKELTRKNDLFVQNGDIHDEQMAGIGELFKKLNESVEGLANAIENNS